MAMACHGVSGPGPGSALPPSMASRRGPFDARPSAIIPAPAPTRGQSQRKWSSKRARAASQSQAVELVHSASTPQTSGVGIRTNNSARWQPR